MDKGITQKELDKLQEEWEKIQEKRRKEIRKCTMNVCEDYIIRYVGEIV